VTVKVTYVVGQDASKFATIG